MWTTLLVALAVVLSAGVANAEKPREENLGGKGCSIEGTWHGYNEEGQSFVMTITRTGPETFSAVGQSPVVSPVFPGVLAVFNGVQGDLTRTGPGEFDSTWMAIWLLDPDAWGELDRGAIVSYGEITMPDCDTWEATFYSDAIAYSFGQNPFEDGFVVDSTGPTAAYYKRLPKYPG
jgi:hypothetical protein